MVDILVCQFLEDRRFSGIIQAEQQNANLSTLNVLKLFEERQ